MRRGLVYGAGPLVRKWRKLRKLTQLDLALRAGTSARHLSFVETGRAQPSRDMVLRLADHLRIPRKDRNALLLAAGYAPIYDQQSAEEPELDELPDKLSEALQQLLHGREPYPTFVVDAGKDVVLANRGTEVLLEGVAASLLSPPMNMVRLALHPHGMIGRVANAAQWRAHLLSRLEREAMLSADERLGALYHEAVDYRPADTDPAWQDPADHIMAPLRIEALGADLCFFNVVTTFGTLVDTPLTGLTIEVFYPADATTAGLLHDRLLTGSELNGTEPIRSMTG